MMDARSPALYDLLLRWGPVANQEIAGILGLSPATITHLIQTNEHRGMLKELPAQEYPPESLHLQPGCGHKSRRKTTFRPNPDYAAALVVHCSGRMLHFRRVAFDLSPEKGETGLIEMTDPDRVVAESLALAATLQQSAHPKIKAISLVVPWHPSEPSFGGAFPKSLGRELQRATGLPVRMVDRTAALALHDAFAGAARQVERFFTLQVHDSIGIGLFLNGRLSEPEADEAATLLEPGDWRLPSGARAADCLARAAITSRLERLGHHVEHHETYRVLQQALAAETAPGPAGALVSELAEACAQITVNLWAAVGPQRTFLYSPLNELGDAFSRPLRLALEQAGGPAKGSRLAGSVVLNDEWQRAMAVGAAKAAFDRWLSMSARTSAFPEGSAGPAAEA